MAGETRISSCGPRKPDLRPTSPLLLLLLLFDIDGTLLQRAADDHRDAIHAALRRVYHVQDPTVAKVQTAGRTDPWIARSILLQLGVSATRIDEGMRDFKRAAVDEYRRRCRADLGGHVVPGMADVLDELDKRPDVLLSLVTGNLEGIAHHKLGRAGIGDFFERGQGGFGSDHEDRAALPGIARARAGSRERPHPRADTIVIGDTPLDIACARADGVRCIAVTTGPHRATDLGAADHVVSTPRQLLAALDAG